jgi:hypothetical protein
VPSAVGSLGLAQELLQYSPRLRASRHGNPEAFDACLPDRGGLGAVARRHRCATGAQQRRVTRITRGRSRSVVGELLRTRASHQCIFDHRDELGEADLEGAGERLIWRVFGGKTHGQAVKAGRRASIRRVARYPHPTSGRQNRQRLSKVGLLPSLLARGGPEADAAGGGYRVLRKVLRAGLLGESRCCTRASERE